MSSLASVNTAFALALASQAESVGTARLDAPTRGDGSTVPDIANLLATVDPKRAAFASALLRIDVANAPQVAGPYVPGTASGPLTDEDIFDPSRLYSLPSRELVVSDEAAAASTTARVAATVPPDTETTSPTISTAIVKADDAEGVEVGRSMAEATQSTLDLSSGSKTSVGAAGIEARPSTLTLEFAVAGYMSLMRAGLSPTKRKILRRLKARDKPGSDDRAQSSAAEWDVDAS